MNWSWFFTFFTNSRHVCLHFLFQHKGALLTRCHCHHQREALMSKQTNKSPPRRLWVDLMTTQPPCLFTFFLAHLNEPKRLKYIKKINSSRKYVNGISTTLPCKKRDIFHSSCAFLLCLAKLLLTLSKWPQTIYFQIYTLHWWKMTFS